MEDQRIGDHLSSWVMGVKQYIDAVKDQSMEGDSQSKMICST